MRVQSKYRGEGPGIRCRSPESRSRRDGEMKNDTMVRTETGTFGAEKDTEWHGADMEITAVRGLKIVELTSGKSR